MHLSLFLYTYREFMLPTNEIISLGCGSLTYLRAD